MYTTVSVRNNFGAQVVQMTEEGRDLQIGSGEKSCAFALRSLISDYSARV